MEKGSSSNAGKRLCLFKKLQRNGSKICPRVSLKQHFCPGPKIRSLLAPDELKEKGLGAPTARGGGSHPTEVGLIPPHTTHPEFPDFPNSTQLLLLRSRDKKTSLLLPGVTQPRHSTLDHPRAGWTSQEFFTAHQHQA